MRILLTNDDGITAPGIAALYHAVKDRGEVAVVAPASEQTGVGHGITVRRPMAVQRVRVDSAFEGWSVDGRPADCVKLAILELLDRRPDVVISGINAGLNTAMCVLTSGTLAGAAEAAVFFGISSMAVSLQISPDMNYEQAAKIAAQVLDTFAGASPHPGSCLNVNIPVLEPGRPKGIRVCRRSAVMAEIKYRRETDTLGRTTYCFDGGDPELLGEPGTDADAVHQGYVAVTPLQFHHLDPSVLADVSRWKWPEELR